MGKLDLVKQFNRQCDDVVDTALTISEKYIEMVLAQECIIQSV